jgi:hypothetical protein
MAVAVILSSKGYFFAHKKEYIRCGGEGEVKKEKLKEGKKKLLLFAIGNGHRSNGRNQKKTKEKPCAYTTEKTQYQQQSHLQPQEKAHAGGES